MSNSQTEKTVINLEKKLLEHATRIDLKELSNLLDEDFFEFGTSGNVWTRERALDVLPKEDENSIEAWDFKARELSPSIYQVTYITKRDNYNILRSSIWRLRDSRWQMVFHQGTKN